MCLLGPTRRRGPAPAFLPAPSRRSAAFVVPRRGPCIRGRLDARPGIAASGLDEEGSLRTRKNTNRPRVRFRALPTQGTLELRPA